MDSITRIERVKRVARLADYWGKHGHDGEVVAVVRSHPTTIKADAGENMVSFVATTEAIDVDDEVVIAAGVKADSYFFRNKACFIDHQYDMDNFIGNARRVIPRPDAKSPRSWEVQIRLHKEHRHAPMILGLAADGLIGSSIGFARIKGGKPTDEEVKRYSAGGRQPITITREWEWIEQSIVGMPANVDARAIGYEAAKAAMLDELLTKGTIDRTLAVGLGLPDSPKRRLFPTADPEPAVRRRIVRVIDTAPQAM